MPQAKQGKRAAKSLVARTIGRARKRRLLTPGASERGLRLGDKAIKKRFTKAEQKRFKRFQKSAKKVGLLVSRHAYQLYFRDHLAE